MKMDRPLKDRVLVYAVDLEGLVHVLSTRFERQEVIAAQITRAELARLQGAVKGLTIILTGEET